MAQPPRARHFYLSHNSSWSLLRAIYNMGAASKRGDICRHAWRDILRIYFPAEYDPAQLATGRATLYHVLSQAYQGLPLDFDQLKKPECVTVQLDHIVPGPGIGPGIDEHKRDILWVECKPPNQDQPGSWDLVMRDAVERLAVVHSNRALYIVLNVGLEWLPFYWDPNNSAAAGNALAIKASPGHQNFPVDPRMRPPPNVNAGHIDANNLIHTERAKTLDCFTTAQVNDVTVLAYQADLDFLEGFLQVVANHQYIGWNNPSFDPS